MNNYDWTTGNCEGVCGHYTQVVWDVSDEVGCSYAHCLGGTEVFIIIFMTSEKVCLFVQHGGPDASQNGTWTKKAWVRGG